MLDNEIFEELWVPAEIHEIVWKWKVNRVYKIKFFSTWYILRVSRPSEQMPEKTFEKESWCSEQVESLGVKSVWWIKIGKLWVRDYMLYEYIEGVDWNDSVLDKKILRETLGRCARKYHYLGLKDLQNRGCENLWIWIQDYKKRIQKNIDALWPNDELRNLWIVNDFLSKRLRDMFFCMLNKKHQLWLIHWDLSLKNLIVWIDDNFYLIDWWSAEIAVAPRCEFAEIIWCHIESRDIGYPLEEDMGSFLRWYWIPDEEIEATLSEAAKRVILICIDRVRRAIKERPDRIERYEKMAKKELTMCLKTIWSKDFFSESVKSLVI